MTTETITVLNTGPAARKVFFYAVNWTWKRVRERAHLLHGVSPLRLHRTRHTFASQALEAGKSIRLIEDQLGHAESLLRSVRSPLTDRPQPPS